MIKVPNTLTYRLTLWYAAAFLACFLAALLILYVTTQSLLNARLDNDLREDIADFQELFHEEGLEPVIQEIEREVASSDESEIFIRVFELNGRVLFSSDLSHWSHIDSDKKSQLPQSSAPLVLETKEVSEQPYPVRIITGHIAPQVVMQIGESQGKIHEIMNLFLVVLGTIVALGIPLACGVGWLIARKAVSGIEEVSRAAGDFGKGELNRRVSLEAQGEEIQSLGETFNAMAERIKSLILEMRDMTENIAHDLRSPLTRIRAMSEVALGEHTTKEDCRKTAVDTLKECDRLMQMINTTLDLAEIEGSVTPEKKDHVDLTQLVTDLCEFYEPLMEEKRITLQVSLEPGCQLMGHKSNLQRMVANVLDNAVKYTPQEGTVQVKLTQNTHACCLEISDTGVGIPSSDCERIFERFFRCDHSRSPQNGCGLGLSFARAVARSHEGDIQVTSEIHAGSTFLVSLPLQRLSG